MMFYDFAERIRALERQEEKDIIPLNAGNTNISVPGCAIQAMSEYLRKNKKAQYLPAAGLPELREKIAERENCPVENILVGPGSKYLIYGLFSTLGLKNKKILVPQPHWPAYGLIAKKLGLTVEAIETSLDNRWDFGELNFDESNILMLCNPLNPTSTTYGHDLIERTIESAKQKSVSVIIDEAYKGLAYNKIKDYDAIRVRSFSKEFNMENFSRVSGKPTSFKM